MDIDVAHPAHERQVARALQEYLDAGAEVRFTWHPGAEGHRLVVEVCEPEVFSAVLAEVVKQRG